MTDLHPINTPDEKSNIAPQEGDINREDLAAQDVIQADEAMFVGSLEISQFGIDEEEEPIGQEPQQPGVAVTTGERTTRSESVEGMVGEVITPSMTDEALPQTVAEAMRLARAERFEDVVRGAPGWPRSDRRQSEAA